MILTDTGGTSASPCPAGSYPAKCVRIVDMGTQTSSYDGETKHVRKVMLAWEILDDDCLRDDGKPFVLYKSYSQSLHEKSAFRKDLRSWRGSDLTAAELRGFDLAALLGKTCYLSVVHVTKGDRTFANVSALMRLPRGMSAERPALSDRILWDMNAPEWEMFDKLPSRIQDRVRLSPEFSGLQRPPPAVRSPATPVRPPPPNDVSEETFEDEVDV